LRDCCACIHASQISVLGSEIGSTHNKPGLDSIANTFAKVSAQRRKGDWPESGFQANSWLETA
jgi:hypothetical protein